MMGLPPPHKPARGQITGVIIDELDSLRVDELPPLSPDAKVRIEAALAADVDPGAEKLLKLTTTRLRQAQNGAAILKVSQEHAKKMMEANGWLGSSAMPKKIKLRRTKL